MSGVRGRSGRVGEWASGARGCAWVRGVRGTRQAAPGRGSCCDGSRSAGARVRFLAAPLGLSWSGRTRFTCGSAQTGCRKSDHEARWRAHAQAGSPPAPQKSPLPGTACREPAAGVIDAYRALCLVIASRLVCHREPPLPSPCLSCPPVLSSRRRPGSRPANVHAQRSSRAPDWIAGRARNDNGSDGQRLTKEGSGASWPPQPRRATAAGDCRRGAICGAAGPRGRGRCERPQGAKSV